MTLATGMTMATRRIPTRTIRSGHARFTNQAAKLKTRGDFARLNRLVISRVPGDSGSSVFLILGAIPQGGRIFPRRVVGFPQRCALRACRRGGSGDCGSRLRRRLTGAWGSLGALTAGRGRPRGFSAGHRSQPVASWVQADAALLTAAPDLWLPMA